MHHEEKERVESFGCSRPIERRTGVAAEGKAKSRLPKMMPLPGTQLFSYKCNFYLFFFFFPNFFSFTRSKDTVASLEGLANEEHTTETNKIAAALMKKELMKSKDKVSWFIAFNFFNRFPPFFPFYSLLLLRLFRRVIPPPRGSHCWPGA